MGTGMGYNKTNDLLYKPYDASEALEKWPIHIFQPLLPRIYMIVEEINERFCRELWEQTPGNWQRICNLAIIADNFVKMAHLAIVGSFSVNGVAKLHTEILKKREMNQFYQLYPEKFNNKTNGIAYRRWLLKANPSLSALITDAIGPSWTSSAEELTHLLKFKNDTSFLDQLLHIKNENKQRLAEIILDKTGVKVDTGAIFDVQVKRLHAYKRQ